MIHDGTVDFKALSKLDLSDDELKEAKREHGVEHFTDVKLAMLEIDGSISIISKEREQLKQTHYKRKPSKNSTIENL